MKQYPTKSTFYAFPEQQLLRSETLAVYDMANYSHQLSTSPHRHDHYTLMWIRENREGKQVIGANSYKMLKNRMFFMAPEQIHKMDGQRYEGWLFLFGEEAFRHFLNTHPIRETTGITTPATLLPYVDLPGEELDFFDFTFKYVFNALRLRREPFSILYHQLSLVLLKLNALHYQQHHLPLHQEAESNLYLKLVQLIDRYYSTEHKVAFYAEILSKHPRTINNTLRKVSGNSLVDLLHERLLNEAKLLFRSTDLSVKEISYILGFKDPSYFNRFFKRKAGITPFNFRCKYH